MWLDNANCARSHEGEEERPRYAGQVREELGIKDISDHGVQGSERLGPDEVVPSL